MVFVLEMVIKFCKSRILESVLNFFFGGGGSAKMMQRTAQLVSHAVINRMLLI